MWKSVAGAVTVGATFVLTCAVAWTVGAVVGGVACTVWGALLGAPHASMVAIMQDWVASLRLLVCEAAMFVGVCRPLWSSLAKERIQGTVWVVAERGRGHGAVAAP